MHKFLAPDVASVEVLGLNVTYTFFHATTGRKYYFFEDFFQKDPVAAKYSRVYQTYDEIMDGAVTDLKGFGSSAGMHEATFSQKKKNSNRQFGPEGQAKYSKIGRQ